MKDIHEENRLSWNAATVAHNSHKGDQAKFFREGGSTLHAEEKELLGDISGLELLHLQCNSGQDTLSLARLGATVTGVDISDTAIEFARKLAADSGIPATFYRADVYDWLAEAAASEQRFDVVFSSYGALVWLSDLKTWARGFAALLKPGGRFVLVEFHPVIHMFEWDLERKYPYFRDGEPLLWENGVGDYVAFSTITLPNEEYVEGVKDFKNPHRVYEFQWGIGEVVTALLEAGLQITTLKEYPYANDFRPFERMQEDDGHWTLAPDLPNLPLMYAIAAKKTRQ
ncbi:MAG TPA: class I SAM-dependent methyltransferase [Ktedonobacteraceae bacterium]|nr:class I SAM-dependent methyltransferase [Ktedonobacteraceae bacterium]